MEQVPTFGLASYLGFWSLPCPVLEISFFHHEVPCRVLAKMTRRRLKEVLSRTRYFPCLARLLFLDELVSYLYVILAGNA